MIIQARWITDPDILTLPHITDRILPSSLCQLLDTNHETLTNMLNPHLTSTQIDEVYEHLTRLPQIELNLRIRGFWSSNEETRTLPNTAYADQEYTLQIHLKRINQTRVRHFLSL